MAFNSERVRTKMVAVKIAVKNKNKNKIKTLAKVMKSCGAPALRQGGGPSALGGLVFALLLCCLLAPVAMAGNIFESHVETRLKLTPQQRSKVTRVVRASDRQMQKIFRQHGINPNGPVSFTKLVAASGDLRRVESQERRAMKKILNAEQLRHYDQLIEQTAIRVRKAAR